jgi:glycosyltransferase involved in cell wall biosynthesis
VYAGDVNSVANRAKPGDRWRGRSVLILENGLLKPRREPSVRGIELFRFNLIHEFVQRDMCVTLICEKSWAARAEAILGEDLPELLVVPNVAGAAVNGLLAARKARNVQADLLFIGNPGRGMLPAARALARRAENVLIMAHRPAKDSLIKGLRGVRARVVAVSEYVAEPYKAAGAWEVGVMYGIAGADAFFPRESPKGAHDPVNIIVLGKIDSPLKGSEDAIAAFEALPNDARATCRLHLASYVGEPPALPEGVIAHGWIPAPEIPVLLRDMDIMLSPSKAETFSQATVQGMLTGLPIIASDLPVLVEKLDTDGGVVATGVNAMRDAMLRLAQDADLRARMGAIGRRTALERYVWDTDVFLERWAFHLAGGDS